MNTQEKLQILSSIGEEIINKPLLEQILENKEEIIAYDGFEPSGRMHIAQGLLRAHNVNKFINSGIKFKFWIADWFALMNHKLNGNLEEIQKAGYKMINVWKACGMNTELTDKNGNPMIQFIWSSNEINKRSDEYWKLVLDISTKFNLNRVKKCTQIMGRENSDDLSVSQMFYPVMQCADIFFLNVDICSLGLDQRKVNMLAIEYCDKVKKTKPIIISHHMLMGLDGSDKMSKSNPNNTVFMDDTPQDIRKKINKAFCEPSNVEKNPLLDWCKHLVFPIKNVFIIPANNEDSEIIYESFEKLYDDFKNNILHPKKLKEGMIHTLLNLLEPIQKKFNEN